MAVEIGLNVLERVKRAGGSVVESGQDVLQRAESVVGVVSRIASGMKDSGFTTRSYSDFLPIAERVFKLLVKDIQIESTPALDEIAVKHKQLVCAQSHGPAMGPMIYTLAMCHYFCNAGAGDRKPIAITHRLFYQLPVMDRFARFITQVPRAVGFEEFVELFNSGDYNDLCLMPEGDHCNFGNGLDVMPFKSPKFVEIAIRSQCPILIISHAGAEAWGRELPMPEPLLERFLGILPEMLSKPIEYSRSVNLPRFIKPIEQLRIKMELFPVPDVNLDEMYDAERKALIVKLADEVRERMQALVDELKVS